MEVRHMCRKINVLGVHIDYMNVEASMNQIAEMMKNDRMNMVSMVTISTLMLARRDPVWKQYIEDMDLTVIGDDEILKAADIFSGRIMDEVEAHSFVNLFFNYMIRNQKQIFVLGETKKEVDGLKNYLQDAYPGILVAGDAVVEDSSSPEKYINEVNSLSVDVIVSGLSGFRQDMLAFENKSQLNSKLWLCLGKQPFIQSNAGLKVSRWSRLLMKNEFKRMVAKYKEKNCSTV